MKIARFFLIIGLCLSFMSKFLQMQNNTIWGNLLVLPAATFSTLAILMSIKKYRLLLSSKNLRKKAIILGVLACLTVISFQLLTITVIGHNMVAGVIFLIPLFTFFTLFIIIWYKSSKMLNEKKL